jgi:regulator of protease activity HflC (stomatin/prohibitin superfamily)
MMFELILAVLVVVALVLLTQSVVIVRPTHRALIERFGKYKRQLKSGLSFKLPFIESAIRVNVTEQMVDAASQQVITADNLNATVDAQIYFKVKDTEEDVKASQYNVNEYRYQIVSLARTTLRDIIGKMPFKDVNNKRDVLNAKLALSLKTETNSWGIDIVRTELKEIEPPQDVQETMNKVLKAENEKIAATDFATARETEADGFKRAEIKKAEGMAKGIELRAAAQAEAIRVISESANKHFKEPAQKSRQLEVLEKVLGEGTVYVVSPDSPMLNVLQLHGKAPKTVSAAGSASIYQTLAEELEESKKK